MRYICEISGARRFSSFSTQSAQSGSGCHAVRRPLLRELSPNFGDGRSRSGGGGCGLTVGRLGGDLDPVVVTPRTSFGNWLVPSRRRQLFCAASSSLKTIASAVLLDRQPFDRIVRWRTVAKVLSMGLVVRKCFQCSAGKS